MRWLRVTGGARGPSQASRLCSLLAAGRGLKEGTVGSRTTVRGHLPSWPTHRTLGWGWAGEGRRLHPGRGPSGNPCSGHSGPRVSGSACLPSVRSQAAEGPGPRPLVASHLSCQRLSQRPLTPGLNAQVQGSRNLAPSSAQGHRCPCVKGPAPQCSWSSRPPLPPGLLTNRPGCRHCKAKPSRLNLAVLKPPPSSLRASSVTSGPDGNFRGIHGP